MIRRTFLFVAALLLAPHAVAQPKAGAPVAEAIYAGGCFWCVEHDLEALPGVISVVSGYTGGTSPNPTYENHDGHVEAVRVRFDPARISYRSLTDRFLRSIDVFDEGGQFCDRGYSYTTAIFATTAQRADAEAAKAAAERFLGRRIVTPIREATFFTDAEGYHQDYAKRNPVRYRFYRTSCGRDARVRQVWGQAAKAKAK